ncbi:MAG: sugar nucleotide-binding protein [Verrucomicrobia bacterium]|nr:sugar nucleotide-binding protein [Verrucomicrobiota bacterium]
MILLLGATGHIGQAFGRELRRHGRCFVPLSRRTLDYTNFENLFDYVRGMKPELVINAAGYSGRPNIDDCEFNRIETFQANAVLPEVIGRVCQMTRTPWGHVSSGSIYSGARVFENGELSIVRDLNRPGVRQLHSEHPELFVGFSELDEANASFRCPPCSFYVGTKALAEERIGTGGQNYIWRVRMPFNERDEPWNLLTKLQCYPRIRDDLNSISQVDDFALACLQLWDRQAPFGIYNVINPGAVTTREIVEMIQRTLCPERAFDYWLDDEEFYRRAVQAPRTSCILDASKLLRAGVKMRTVREALADSLRNWQPAEELRISRKKSSFGDGRARDR